MTEYHKPNGVLSNQQPSQHYDDSNEPSLEDSITSLLSSIQRAPQPTLSRSRLQSSYRKAAKSFINKRFGESFTILEEITENAVVLFNNAQIKESLFLNVWSLYLNLIDILINKEQGLSSVKDQQRVEALYFSKELFEQLGNVYQAIHPQLIVQLLLIKLNNSATDLKQLRQQIDLYFVNNRVTDDTAPEFKDYKELLEIYHVHLLAKLGEFKEAESLIKANPLIYDPNAMIEKLHEVKKQIEEEEQQRVKLAKLKKQQELKIKQKAKELLAKKLEEAKRAEQEKRKQKKDLATKPDKTSTKLNHDDDVDDLVSRFINLIKAKLNSKSLGLVVVISLISFILFIQKNKWLLNAKVRRYLLQVWEKVLSTLKMAFSATYL